MAPLADKKFSEFRFIKKLSVKIKIANEDNDCNGYVISRQRNKKSNYWPTQYFSKETHESSSKAANKIKKYLGSSIVIC